MSLILRSVKGSRLTTAEMDANLQGLADGTLITGLGYINVKNPPYNAVGDGSTDDSTAIKAAINAACATTLPKKVYFPSGNYKITVSNTLGPNVNTTGMVLYGDGPEASKITLTNTGATDFWFYDNGAASASNPSLIAPTFMNLGFVGSVSSSGKVQGFRLYGTPGFPSQKFRFINCYGSGITTVLDSEGTSNASENYFGFCQFTSCGTFIYNNNPQAVNNCVVACDFESYTGNVFDYQNGGQLNVYGGSFVTSSANTTYILNSVAPAGGITGEINFHGIRCELSSATSKICNITGTNNGGKYQFNGCNFAASAGGSRTSIILGGKGSEKVKFISCLISSNHSISWIEGTSNYWFSNSVFPTLEFDGCSGITVSSLAYTDTFSLGYTRIKNSTDGTKDWEGSRLGYVAGGSPENAFLKVAKGWVYYWPDVANNTSGIPSGAIGSQVIIPIGSTIKSIYARKASRGGGGTANYQLEVRDGAGTPALITVPAFATGSNQSTAANQGAEHNIIITNLLKAVTDLASGTITIRCVAGGGEGSSVAATMTTGDYFFVEYV